MRTTRTLIWLLLAVLLGAGGFLIPAYFLAIDPSVVEIAAQENRDRVEVANSYQVDGNPVAAQFLLDNWDPQQSNPSDTFPVWDRLFENGEESGSAVQPLLSSAKRDQAIRLLGDSDLEGVRRLRAEIPAEPSPGSPPEVRLSILPSRIGAILTTYFAAERSFQPQFLSEVVSWSNSPNPRDQQKWDTFTTEISVWGSLSPFGALAQFFTAFETPDDFLSLASYASRTSPGARTFLINLVLSGAEPDAIYEYLRTFPSTGLEDLTAASADGPGAVELLLDTELPIREDGVIPASAIIEPFDQPVLLAYRTPHFALLARVSLFLLAFFCLVKALSGLLPNPRDRDLEEPRLFQDLIRKGILASILTATLLFLLEPALLQQQAPPIRSGSPSISFASLTNPSTANSMMNSITIDSVTLLILSIFLVLQLGLYVFCLVKLSEIRRQRVSEETKLRLLDNEENLFDSGLYLGLGGTVASLILLAVGVVEASLMAAYASTLFGILFVSFFKIFHLRPLKRRLILSAQHQG